MENQKSSLINPLLNQTSRQFYTRRVPQRSNSNVQIQKVLRLLGNTTNERKHYIKAKTEQRQEIGSTVTIQMDNMRKMARVKVENAIKRQGKQWKQLLDSFQTYSKSSSKECLVMNQINFLLKMEEVIKKNCKINQKSDKIMSKESLQYRVKDHKLQIDNIKLQKEVQMLKELLEVKENQFKAINASINTIASPRNSLQAANNQQIQKEVFIIKRQQNQLQRQLQTIRHANDLLREQKKSLQDKISELKISNQNLCEEIMKNRNYSNQNKQKFEMWRNIMSMQTQEIISLRSQKAQLRNSLMDLNKKYQNMLRRISKISAKDQAKLNEITKKNVQIFTEQIESFQRIRSNFIIKGFYNTYTHNSKDVTTSQYKKYFSEKETMSNSDGVKKAGKQALRYYKPTFYVYLQKYFQYQGVDRQNFSKIDLSIGVSFLATLRSILDSKFNQYLLTRKTNKQFSSLPNFTLSWLSNFTLDPKTKNQEQITTDVCFQTIGTFYVRLMSHHLNSNWQIITFRQFLLQTLTTDQLVFYLKARFILLKGDSLKGSGSFTQIIYVNILDALFLIQLVVSDFDYRKKLEQYIKKSTQLLRKKQLIDAHFVLRLLLEYYQYKKAQSFSVLSKAFYTYVREKNTNMPFQKYLKIFDYITFELTLVQRGEIYQKAFSLGRGTVYLQNIFTVMNEEGYFCYQVEKIFEKKPLVEETASEKPKFARQQQLPEPFKSLANLIEKKLEPQSSKLGVQWNKKVINQLKLTKQNLFNDMLKQIEITFEISMLYIKKLFATKWLNDQDVQNILPIFASFLQHLTKHSMQKKKSIEFMQKFLKKNAARQILRLYRKKRLINRGFLNQIDYGDKTKEKSEELKKELNSAIDNLKKRFGNQTKMSSEREIQQ